jgi:DNA uptake protein ComE-like DNA-binding protein
MKWKDLLYFSKGERRALTLLLFLVSISGVLLVINDRVTQEDEPRQEAQYIVNPANAPVPMQVDSAERLPERRVQRERVAAVVSPKQRASYPRTEKFPAGTKVELNTADTLTLKKVPGIGSVFARRIVKYRALLGGFYTVDQLRELYGMDEERYLALQTWFYTDTTFIAKLPVNFLPADSLAKHPYLNYRQARTLYQLRRQKGRLAGWENLNLLEEFTEADKERLVAYLAF